MPLMKKFYFCFSLRTGSFIIGVFSLIASLLLGALGVLSLILWEDVIDALKKERHYDPEVDNLAFAGAVTLVVICILAAIASSLLVHGVRTYKPTLLLPYVATTIIEILIAIIFGTYAAIFLVGKGIPTMTVVIIAFILIIAIAENLHYALVVFSHYQELRAGYRPTQTRF